MTCLHPGCEEEVSARGLCQRHLQQARRLIAAKKATEKELIARGMMLPAFAKRRDMLRWLEKSRAEAPDVGKKPARVTSS